MKRIELNKSLFLTTVVTAAVLSSYMLSVASEVQSLFVLLSISLVTFFFRMDKALFMSLFASMFVASFSYELSSDLDNIPINSQEILVAHLVLDENNKVAELYQSIEQLEVDLLSVQTPIAFVDDPSFSNSTRNMPHVQRTICNDSMMIMVYSKNALTNLDTLCYNNAIAIAGDVVQSGKTTGIKVLSSYLSDKVYDNENYEELNRYINHHCTDKPFLSLGVSNLDNINLRPNSSNIGRSKRTPSSFIPTFPISHSEKLRCIQVNSMKNGMGVIARYQVI